MQPLVAAMRTAPIAAILAVVTGCSMFGVKSPPAPCTTSSVLPALDVSAAAGFIALIPTSRDEGTAWTLGLIATTFAVSAPFGFVWVSGCRTQGRDRAHEDALERSRARASQLIETAEATARAGDCETVRTIDPQVFALDPDLHETVFLADLGVKACLPSPQTTRARCLTQRVDRLRAANNIVDLQARVRALRGIPPCSDPEHAAADGAPASSGPGSAASER